jgi:hypothetical protein
MLYINLQLDVRWIMYKFNSFGGRDCFRLIDNIFSTMGSMSYNYKPMDHLINFLVSLAPLCSSSY